MWHSVDLMYHICDTTHWCTIWLIHTYVKLIYMWHSVDLIYHICDTTHWCTTWLIHIYMKSTYMWHSVDFDVSHTRHDSLMYDKTHAYVHEIHIYVTFSWSITESRLTDARRNSFIYMWHLVDFMYHHMCNTTPWYTTWLTHIYLTFSGLDVSHMWHDLLMHDVTQSL